MPIFEFECQTCGTPFEELIRSSSTIEGVTCPDCGSPQIRKKISMIAARKPAKSSFSFGSGSSSPGCSTGSSGST